MQLQNFYAQDVNGNIVPGATCSLFLPGTTTLATGLVDIDGNPVANPTTANANGLLQFAAPNGLYDLKIEAGLIVSTLRVTFADNLEALEQLGGFLGPQSSPPLTRADGTPLRIGDRYIKTPEDIEYIYMSTGWEASNSSSSIIYITENGTATTVEAALRRTEQNYFPDMYGLIGVSVAGDTAAIQAAIEAAKLTNGAVLGRPGVTYNISSVRIKNGVRKFDFTQSLIIPDSSTSGVGTGAIQLDGNRRFLTGTPVDNCYVATNMSMVNGGRVGIFADGCTNCNLWNNTIKGFTDHPTINHYGILGWYATNGNSICLNNIEGVQDPTQRGLLIDLIGEGIAFAGYFANSGATVPAISPCTDNVIAGNNLTYGSYGVNLLGGNNNLITKNVCRGQNHRAIYFAEACLGNSVADNELLDFRSSAVLLGYGCNGNRVVNNECRRDLIAPGGEAVMNINTGATDNIVSGNKCFADTNYGIYMACNAQRNIIESNEVGGYYLAGIALETDWEASADRPAGAIYSRPNYATPGSISPGATQWAFSNADSNIIRNNTIRAGTPGRSVAAIYCAQVDSNSNLSLVRNNIYGNMVFGNSDMAYYFYFFEETVDKAVNNKLSDQQFTDTSGVPSARKIFMSRGRMHFNYQVNNDVIDFVATTFANGDTSPSVSYGGSFAFNNSSATVVTTFDDAPPGYVAKIRMSANTTLVHNNSVMRLAGRCNVSGRTTNDTITLKNQSATTTPLWVEEWRSFSLDAVGSITYDPPSIGAGASATPVTVTVSGAALGDATAVSFTNSLAGIVANSYVSAPDTVVVTFTNPTAAPIDLASGTLTVRAIK